MTVTRERIIEEFETIIDPEIGIDIWTLGLIYDFTVESGKKIVVTMTYTTPLCPYGPALNMEVTDAMRSLGFSAVDIQLTFDPAWKPPVNLREMMGV